MYGKVLTLDYIHESVNNCRYLYSIYSTIQSAVLYYFRHTHPLSTPKTGMDVPNNNGMAYSQYRFNNHNVASAHAIGR